MRVGVFADSHDHLDNIQLAVKRFTQAECAGVLLAGDLVSTIVVPPLRALRCPFVGCFGDNKGNIPTCAANQVWRRHYLPCGWKRNHGPCRLSAVF